MAGQLEEAIENNNESVMQALSEDAEREISNLPDQVKLVRACVEAIKQAKAIAPTQARAMSEKLGRMVEALVNSDGREAERLWQELQPDVSHWLNQDLPTHSIATGLTR